MEDLKEKIKKQEDTIKGLENEVSKLELEVGELELEVSKLENEIGDLEDYEQSHNTLEIIGEKITEAYRYQDKVDLKDLIKELYFYL